MSNKWSKRLLAFMLMAVMVFAAVPAQVSAASSGEYDAMVQKVEKRIAELNESYRLGEISNQELQQEVSKEKQKADDLRLGLDDLSIYAADSAYKIPNYSSYVLLGGNPPNGAKEIQAVNVDFYVDSLGVSYSTFSQRATVTWSINGGAFNAVKQPAMDLQDDLNGTFAVPLIVGENTLRVKCVLDKEEQITEVKITRQDGKDFRIKSVEYPDGDVRMAGNFKESRRGITAIAEQGLKRYNAVYTSVNPAATITVTQNGRTVAKGVGKVTVALSTETTASIKVWNGFDVGKSLEYTQKVRFRDSLAPNRVYGIMPAPGQFVNEGSQTLTGSADGFGWGEGWDTSLYAFGNEINSSASGMPGISLGSFGGSIIYQFDEPVKNSPSNSFGVDFMVQGNAFPGNNEPAGIMVAKDDGTGKPDKWYNLAGSEHYEDTTDWNYSVTYTNTNPAFFPDIVRSVPWTDSKGNSGFVKRNGFHTQSYYPNSKNYVFDSNAVKDLYNPESMTYTGVNINTLNVGYGYAETVIGKYDPETFVQGNPYTGDYRYFDIDWAVDDAGMPIDLDEISFVKVFTCQLTDGGAVGEKSPEVLLVQRADKAGKTSVGQTAAPKRVTITAEGFNPIKLTNLTLQPGESVYDVNVGNMRFVKLAAETSDSDTIYINNNKVKSGEFIDKTYEVTKDNPRLIRILNQNGNKEPSIITLRLTSSAEASKSFLNNMKFRVADRSIDLPVSQYQKDRYSAVIALGQGEEYHDLQIVPNVPKGVAVSVNGSALQKDGISKPIAQTGETTAIKITVNDGKVTQNAELRITQQKPKTEIKGSITVTFTLLGAPIHDGKGPMLSYKENKDKLITWIPKTTYVVPEGSAVLAVFEKALGEAKLTYVNDFGGNYISSITSPEGKKLAEFTNGPNSGWMYLVNGEYPQFGLAEFKIKDGDNIVWHYTDDYKLEDCPME